MTQPTSSRARGWQLCRVPGGSLHVKRVAGFSEIRNALMLPEKGAFSIYVERQGIEPCPTGTNPVEASKDAPLPV